MPLVMDYFMDYFFERGRMMPLPLAKPTASGVDDFVSWTGGASPNVGAAPPSFWLEPVWANCSALLASAFFIFEASGDSPPFMMTCDMEISFEGRGGSGDDDVASFDIDG
jgi:hypothetical protein